MKSCLWLISCIILSSQPPSAFAAMHASCCFPCCISNSKRCNLRYVCVFKINPIFYKQNCQQSSVFGESGKIETKSRKRKTQPFIVNFYPKVTITVIRWVNCIQSRHCGSWQNCWLVALMQWLRFIFSRLLGQKSNRYWYRINSTLLKFKVNQFAALE